MSLRRREFVLGSLVKRGLFSPSGQGGDGGSSASIVSPIGSAISTLRLFISSANLSTLWQEPSTSQPITRVFADGQRVGAIDEPSSSTHHIQAGSSASSPILASGGGRNSSFLFVKANNNFWTIYNSKLSFQEMYTGQAYTWGFWASVPADGVVYNLFDSCSGSTANAGFLVVRTAANRIQVFIVKASPGNVVVNYTSTATFTVSDGFIPILFSSDGSTLTLRIGLKTPELVSTAAGISAGTGTFANVTIGTDAGQGANRFDGNLDTIIYASPVLSAAEIAAFQVYNPLRTSNSFSSITASNGNAADLTGLNTWYRYSDASTLFQDTTLAIPVAINTDPIRVARNVNMPWTNRDAIANSDATRPLWTTGVTGGRAAGTWDGVDDNLIFQSQWPKMGSYTMFCVAKNLNTTLGSHLLYTGGSGYWTYTAEAYVGNPHNSILHTDSGGGTAVSVEEVNRPNLFNILEYWRDGSTMTILCNGVGVATFPNVNSAGGQTSPFLPSQMGKESLAGWWLKSNVCEFVAYNLPHTPAARSYERMALASYYGISNVTP